MLVTKIVFIIFQKFEGSTHERWHFYSHTSIGLAVPSLCLGKADSMTSYQITSMRINKSNQDHIGDLFLGITDAPDVLDHLFTNVQIRYFEYSVNKNSSVCPQLRRGLTTYRPES